MKKITSHWLDYADQLTLVFDKSDYSERQPSIGIEICWNIPRVWWKPFMVVHLWHIHYQIGWFID